MKRRQAPENEEDQQDLQPTKKIRSLSPSNPSDDKQSLYQVRSFFFINSSSFQSVFGHITEMEQQYKEEIMESDTLAAFQMLHDEFLRCSTVVSSVCSNSSHKQQKNEKKQHSPSFPIIFRHQLYSTIQNRTEVDLEVFIIFHLQDKVQIERLCEKQLLRLFLFKQENDCYLCVKNTDYLKYV